MQLTSVAPLDFWFGSRNKFACATVCNRRIMLKCEQCTFSVL